MQTLSKSTVSSQDTLLVLPEGAARHELNDGNRERWLRLIAASPDELGWKYAIPWRQSFRAAFDEAQGRGCPVLMYVSAGDPQGCT